MWTRITALIVLLGCDAGTVLAQAGRAKLPDGACQQLPVTGPAPRRAADPLPPSAAARPAAVNSVRRILDGSKPERAAQVKPSLAKQRPVLFTMQQPDAGKLVGDLWVAASGDPPTPAGQPTSRCGNAFVIVGYDDARYGGAFEVLRDCGATMYAEASFWLRYADFETLCDCAVELVATDAAPAAVAAPPPAAGDPAPPAADAPSALNRGSATASDTDLGARLVFEDASGAAMPAQWTGRSYRMQRPYPSGTRFRVTVTSNPAAYLYAVGSDATQRIVPVFPPSGMPADKLTRVTLPETAGFFEMDDVQGTDYLCMLFSSQPLEIEPLVARLGAADGLLPSRLHDVLGDQGVPMDQVRPADAGAIGLAMVWPPGQVVPLVVEIPHSE